MEERTNAELLELWEKEPLSSRDQLIPALKERGLVPSDFDTYDNIESEYGLYPDTEDPEFIQKLLQKREFSETRQPVITDADFEQSACNPEGEFELTAVQRFVGRFMSPECPYTSALLYHGVGVGKTCAAVTIAESHLRMFPRKSVFIIAPRTIQSGFKRTIFDDETLQIPDDGANQARGCTGNSYLKRTGMEYERDRAVISRRVTQSINTRYKIMGYLQFHRYIEDIIKQAPKGPDAHANDIAVTDILRREFSGRLVIIDEAHNLRDTPKETPQENIDSPPETDLTETQAGKRLTPSLHKVLGASEGMKLVLLTGTPMYNSHVEIVFLMNLLLQNEKKAILSEKDIFGPTGFITKEGKERLGLYASHYVSFMRGENPLTFPVRLRPRGITLDEWPATDIKGAEISDKARKDMVKLPFVPVEFEGEALGTYARISEEAIQKGLTLPSLDEMTQRGNWIFPEGSFESSFEDKGTSYKAVGDATWLREDRLRDSSPKAALTLRRAATCSGIVFVYSRFIKSGATPLALALEANGYSPWNRDRLLIDGIQDDKGRQCAVCPGREKGHKGHRFVPAKYILVTGQANLSPNNAMAIQAARAKTNMNGGEIKIIIGSQVASEGVDFRFVREIYVFDSWFHLNKMEQVLGRGIRTCSHAALPKDQRNCTIHLLINMFEGNMKETADMYMYRVALLKAAQTGMVTRTLKEYAVDCNLNRDAIVISGLSPRKQRDSQGFERPEVNLNDTPFTNICDWIESCDYVCKIPVVFNEETDDISTYDEYAAKWHESQLKSAIKKMFMETGQPMFTLETIMENFSAVPARAISSLLMEIVGNQSFLLQIRGQPGYIVYRNGYYLFQPLRLKDTRIPMALRIADIPVRRDVFDPKALSKLPAIQPPRETVEATSNDYWASIVDWAATIRSGTAPIDVPPEVLTEIQKRYSTDAGQLRETERLIMVSWMVEDIKNNEGYSDEERISFRSALADVLMEFVWDESLTVTEQQLLSKDASGVAVEQLVMKGATTAFRYIEVSTGTVKYVCATGPCSDAVTRVFESSSDDPVRGLVVTPATTARIYGFMVPKGKERAMVFKTSTPPLSGTKPEKGGECEIVSTITYHIKMLKEIAEIMDGLQYKRLILRDEVLDEKERRKAQKKSGTAPTLNPLRQFQNTIRACALKNLILRWLDKMESKKGGIRFFYRPLAALKSGHKGSFVKGGSKA
jgi:hypothetical protein